MLEHITARQKQVEQQARDLASGLEHELSALRKRSSELDALAQTQDRVLFLQVSIHYYLKVFDLFSLKEINSFFIQ